MFTPPVKVLRDPDADSLKKSASIISPMNPAEMDDLVMRETAAPMEGSRPQGCSNRWSAVEASAPYR